MQLLKYNVASIPTVLKQHHLHSQQSLRVAQNLGFPVRTGKYAQVWVLRHSSVGNIARRRLAQFNFCHYCSLCSKLLTRVHHDGFGRRQKRTWI